MNLFFRRLLNFLRPKPRYLPSPVSSILDEASGMDIVSGFNYMYYTSNVGRNLTWAGHELIKNPCDLWMYVDIIQRLRPSLVIETGTHHGGSACFLADIASVLGVDMQVITVDINPKISFNPAEKNVVPVVGRSTAPAVVRKVYKLAEKRLAAAPGHVLVILDSDHTEANVSRELTHYAPLVSKSSYVIVEDTNINGHPVYSEHGPGPYEAVDAFLKDNSAFARDVNCERFLLTFNPRGYIQRIM